MQERYAFLHHYRDNDYEKPKELFKFIADMMERNFSGRKNISILDVGCAKGEFLYYLKKRFSSISPRLYGVDYSAALIKLAREFPGLSGVDFELELAESFKVDAKFDFISATAIISCYDDYSFFLDNLLAHLKADGVIIVTNGFSTSEYDVIMRFRKYYQKDRLESGWNQHSIDGIAKYIERKGRRLIAHKFELPFKLEKGGDVLRSWTLDTDEGQKFTNALNLVWNVWSLEIR